MSNPKYLGASCEYFMQEANFDCLCVSWIRLCGLGGVTTPVSAQNAVSPPASQSDSVAVATLPGAVVLSDGELAKSVKPRLHTAPYFYDKHVTVSVETAPSCCVGLCTALGFARAIRIAGKAPVTGVCRRLSINQGGRR